MTRDEFINKYNEVTRYYKNISKWCKVPKGMVGTGRYSCLVIENVSEAALISYEELFSRSSGCSYYYMEVFAFDEIDRMLALELFYNIALTEKLYLKY